MKLSAMFS